MDATVIRRYIKEDEDEIINICYDTGFFGENLKNVNIFNDKKLFGYLFCIYYLRYEIENCFVAEDVLNNKLIGYIIGTMNTKNQEKLFMIRMFWRICIRVLTYTWWKRILSILNGSSNDRLTVGESGLSITPYLEGSHLIL